jgi:hypothetical protein
MAKLILSKDTYFNTRKLNYTLADWEAFKVANPRPEYTSETCWALHDSMIVRNKPATDSMAIIKLLLNELNIEFVVGAESLKITSDLTGQTIMVLDIENDELLEQLEAAGATVIYITSNVNYGLKVPKMYFDLYPDNYDSNDFPAVDKRNLFKNKNIVVKYINFYDYKNDSNKLYNIIKEINMQINKVLMNPPYDGNLHLKVLDTTLKVVRQNNPDCEIASIQPARWLEDPLAEYKQGSDYKKYKSSITDRLSKLQLINYVDANDKFKIGLSGTDLAIYTFNNSKSVTPQIYSALTLSIINKVLNFSLTNNILKCSNITEKRTLDPNKYYVRVNEMIPFATTGGDKRDNVSTMKTPWTTAVTNQVYTSATADKILRHTIECDTDDEAKIIVASFNNNFIYNLMQLIKIDQHTPLRFLPYMEDYSKVWTDEDYCKFFNLTEEESEFMCRTVDDYRVKDFINYISLGD